MRVEYRIAFSLMYLAAGVIMALLAFVDDEMGCRPLRSIGAATVGSIFFGIVIWPWILLSAVLGPFLKGRSVRDV